jgi:hypothetical protein
MPSHGSLAFNPDNTFTYAPAAGYLGSDQFIYTIRDNRGDSASGSVTLNVVEITESPNALDDHVMTEAGSPVTIDVLANDNLPSDQQITIVAITLPYRGKLAFNPDQTITYTPNDGFIGTDDFTYTVGGGKGDTSRATVTVEVTPASTTNTYANGYGYRRRIVLPAPTADQMTVNDTVVLFAEEADWLRTVANGGKVASPEGADLRFELTDGGKLDHEIEHYDPLAGKLIAWIRLPNWTLSSQLQLIVYYGNSSLTGSEANPAGVWQGYLARWRLPVGSDATGSGRDLVADNVLAGELLGSAASLDGTGRLTLASTSWLDGLSTLTVQALVKPDATMVGSSVRILAQGGAAAAAGITLGYAAETGTGATNVVYAAVGSTDGEAATFSRADRQTSDRQLIHARWQSSDAPQLYLNGSRATPSSSQPRSGVTQSIDGPLEVGRDWVGLIDEVRITDRVLPAAWIAAEAHNMLAPELSYGLGQEETTASAAPSVVAVPFNVDVEAGKWIDVDVLAQIFAPATGESATIVSVGQPSNGSVTVIGSAVRYAPASDFIGKDQFTYTIGNGETQSIGLIVVTVVDPASQGQSELPAGENLLANSKLTGDVGAADNWSNRYPGEGTLTFSSADVDDHRKVRLVATGTSDRASIEQIYRVEEGNRYVFSAYCAAIGSAADPARVVLNHAPFSLGAVVGGPEARPKLADMVPGQRFHYAFDATATGDLKMILGVDGAGDVTLERPMLDRVDTLRGYVATAPIEPPVVDSMNWDFVPYKGWYEGQIQFAATHINTSKINDGGYRGWRMTMRRSGTLAVVQHQIASNFAGETTKSAINGSTSHGYPASWKLGLRVFNADSNWQISGSALREIEWTYINPDGAPNENSRVVFEHNLNNLPVTEGQRLLFLVYNRESNPAANHPSVNMASNYGRPPLGQNPPIAISRYFGDDPILVISSSQGGNLSPMSQRLHGIGIRYSDGVEEGSLDNDATASAFLTYVSGGNRARQRWSSPYWRRSSQIAIAAYRRPGRTPESPLTVRISGPDITTMNLTIPASAVQIYEHVAGTSYTYTHQLFDLPGDLLLSPNTTYTVELFSTGTSSANDYRMHALREYRTGVSNANNTSPAPPNPVTVINPHPWSGNAEKSSDSGNSWQVVGWASGGANLPIALVINRRMATTAEALPA